MNKPWITLAIFATLTINLSAQEEGIGGVEVSVTEQFQASVAQPFKLTGQPHVLDSTVSKLPIKIAIRTRYLDPQTQMKLIPPIHIARTRLKRLPSNHVYLNVGSRSTESTGFALGSSRNPNLTWGVAGDHMSTQGGFRGFEELYNEPATSYEKTLWIENALRGQFTSVLGRSRIRSAIDASWNRYAFYGMKDSLDHPEAPGRWVQDYQASVSYEAPQFRRKQVYGGATLNAHHWIDQGGRQVETGLSALIDWKFPVQDLVIEMPLRASVNQLGGTARPDQNNYWALHLSPTIADSVGQTHFRIGMNMIFTDSISGSLPYFPPVIHIEFPLVKRLLNVYVGMEGGVDNDGMRSRVKNMPFLSEVSEYEVVRHANLYGGISGRISHTMGYRMALNKRDYDNYAMLVRPVEADQLRRLDSGRLFLDHVRASVIAPSAELTLKVGKSVELRGHSLVRLKSINKETNQNIDHLPLFEGGIEVMVNLEDKIRFDADMTYRGYVDYAGDDIARTPLADFVGINARMVYTYNSQLNAVLSVNNLLNHKQPVIAGYPVQGIRAHVGLMYKF